MLRSGMMIDVSLSEQPGFKKTYDVPGVFLEHDGEILLLLRQDHKPYGGTYGMVAGKADPGETIIQALLREIKEEIGLSLSEDDLIFSAKYFVRYPDFDFIHYIYRMDCTQKPELLLNETEHKGFIWSTPQEALVLTLVPGCGTCIELTYGVTV
jgi:8-oxo-dGTP pyrophosphatase MutT (NUDIX family)